MNPETKERAIPTVGRGGISLILATAMRYLLPLLLLFSVYLLARGHNQPGGGFTGGLVAAAAFALYALAYDVERAREALRVEPQTLMGVGLMVATVSGAVPLFYGRPFLTGLWTVVPVFGKVGTTTIFDIGVFLVVIGVTLTIVFTLAES